MEQNARWIETLAEHALASSQVDQSLYAKYEVKRGLRDINGKGVLAGLTKIGEVQAHPEGRPDGPGHLIYRGMDIQDLVAGFWKEGRCGYEEIVHLLLTGHLPAADELAAFTARLDDFRELSHGFVVSILAVSSRDVMNAMARSVLALYSRDERADDISLPNVMRQSLELVAVFPQLAVSSYAAAAYRHGGRSLVLRGPKAGLSTAGNFLRMLRRDEEYTPLEERLLDLALVLHAEHGGGNNSTFTTHVVTSTGTDTYSAIAAALGSLKGPRHGGANAKVLQMFDDLKRRVRDWEDERAIEDYLLALLRKEAFDRQGLIYGMGHAVYSTSDPRTGILRDRIAELAAEKGMEDEFALYRRVERLAPGVIASERRIYKGVSANVDFYSGFLYSLLDIPVPLFTPLFAVARVAGWSAHRLEELANRGKIIRPAYKAVAPRRRYIPLGAR
ncbi:MAG: citrate synthase [Kiritimatiellae bacterium]|nr:citrate synthase [Kiritimatiellia bacterium]